MAITWPDEVDEIISGDLTAALAYVTPAGGAVVTAVAPIGLRDRDAGTVSFTTSLGLGRSSSGSRATRAWRSPTTRASTGSRDAPDFVLVQGDATPATEPVREYLEEHAAGPRPTRFMGPPKEGRLFWDRWLREYYQDRIPVAGRRRAHDRLGRTRLRRPAPTVHGAPARATPSQDEPARGAGPRVDAERAAPRLRGLDHALLAYVGADGYPEVVPVEIGGAGPGGHPPREERAPRAGRPPRRPAGPLLPGEADRPRRPPAHRLAHGRRAGRALCAPHRHGVPGAGEQDAPAVRQRPAGEAGPAARRARRG